MVAVTLKVERLGGRAPPTNVFNQSNEEQLAQAHEPLDGSGTLKSVARM
jgi:hypothetical protein